MSTINRQLLLTCLLTISLGRLVAADNLAYTPTWDSLRRHDTPAWLDEAKFGIYCHWGLRTVQLLPGNAGKTYREVIPGFTAEKFDPAAWADLFAKAGSGICRTSGVALKRLRALGFPADGLELDENVPAPGTLRAN